MPSTASDTLALEDELRACEKRRRDFADALNFVNEYHLNERFPGLANHLLEETEMAARRYRDILLSVANPPRTEPHYEVSVSDAAASLNVSEQTIRNWDQNGCPLDPHYPGRFNAVIFYQWAQTIHSLQNFRREAKKRAILMNSPERMTRKPS